MIVVAITVLAFLAAINYRLANSIIYPPVMYAAFWAGILFLLLICGDRFYPLSEESIMVFVLGVVCFSLGGLFGRGMPCYPSRPPSPLHNEIIWRIIDATIIFMIVLIPFFIFRLQEIIDSSRISSDSFIALRHEQSRLEQDGMTIGIFKYLISLFDIITLVAWNECDGSWKKQKRCIFMTVLLIGYYVSTMGRVGAILFIVSASFLIIIRKGKISVKQLAISACAFIVAFSIAAIVLGKGGDRDAGVAENICGISDAFLHYLLGGPVAFNEVVNNPSIIQRNLFVFIHKVINLFGGNYNTMPYEGIFVPVPKMINVYTLYSSPYAQFGMCGVAIYTFLLGNISAWIHALAKMGKHWARIFCARILGVTMIACNSDLYFPSLSMWIQVGVVCLAIYWLPRLFIGQTDRSGASCCRVNSFPEGQQTWLRIN